MTARSVLRKLTLRSTKNFIDDPVVREFDQGRWIPYWLRYALVGILFGALAAAPIIWMLLTQNPRSFAFPNPALNLYLHLGFVASGILTCFVGGIYATAAAVAAIPWLVRLGDRLGVTGWWLQEEERLQLRQYVLLRRPMGVVFGAILCSVFLVVLFGDVNQEEAKLAAAWSPGNYLVRMAFAVLILAVLLLVKQAIVQHIAINFYRQFYAEKIEENIFAMDMLRRLKDRFGGRVSTLKVTTKRRASSVVSLDPENVDHEDNDEEDEEDADARSHTVASIDEDALTAMATKIVRNLAQPGKDSLRVEDLCRIFSAEKAVRLFGLLDRDQNGDLTIPELAQGSAQIQLEHRDLINSIAQNSKLVQYLDRTATILAALLAFLFVLAIFPVTFGGLVAAIGAAGTVSLLFLKDLAGNLFRAIIFVFGFHPYDVGDVIIVNGKAKYTISRIDLLSTTAVGSANETVYLENVKLAKSSIANIRRSPNQGEGQSLYLSAQTSRAQLMALESRLNAFVAANPRDYTGTVMIRDLKLENRECLKVSFGLGHRSNFFNGIAKDARTRAFSQAVGEILSELKIELGAYPYKPQ